MPQLISYPQINGHRFSFASLEVTFNGIPTLGIKSLNYADELAPGELYGTAPQIIGRTRGKQKATGDCEMYRMEFENLKATLGIAGVGFGETPFTIVVTYFELGTVPVIDTIIGARITKPEQGNTDGTDGTSVKLTFHVMRVLFGGLPIATPINVGI
jgi:hypothetical protein